MATIIQMQVLIKSSCPKKVNSNYLADWCYSTQNL